MDEPKVKFIEGLERLIGCRAISLVWIHEIHIDSKYQNKPILNELIAHEKKHHALLWKAYNEKRRWKRILILCYNNLWDTFDVFSKLLKWFGEKKEA
jgi:hypothetical protein